MGKDTREPQGRRKPKLLPQPASPLCSGEPWAGCVFAVDAEVRSNICYITASGVQRRVSGSLSGAVAHVGAGSHIRGGRRQQVPCISITDQVAGKAEFGSVLGLEAESPRSRCWQGQFLVRPLSWPCRRLCSPCVLPTVTPLGVSVS